MAAEPKGESPAPHWPAAIFAVLKEFDVRQVPCVPDGGLIELIRLAQVEDLAQRAHKVAEAPCVAVVKISRDDPGRVMPVREGAYNKARLRLALGLSAD